MTTPPIPEPPSTVEDPERFRRAIAAIDAANAADPQTIEVAGERRPKEPTHAAMLTEWVLRLLDEPSEALLLAARAHHIRRWERPRGDYPPGRRGYLRWRTDLHAFHADAAAEILEASGYDEATIERVRQIVRKHGLARDPEVQVLEDGLNLVFLQTQFEALSDRLDDDAKMVEIVRKTWRKMSERGRAAALDLPLSPRGRAIVERALRD